MSKIIAISGSLRKGSFNSALLGAAMDLCPDVVSSGTIRGIPLYDGDVEQEQGLPPEVLHLMEQIRESDGIMLVTPEYNNSIPGVFKNAIDWLSRPAPNSAGIFRDKPVALIGASMGGFGTILGQDAWLPVLRCLGARQWFGGRLMVSRAQNLFDANGNLVDPDTRERLQKFIRGFDRFIDAG